MDRGQQLFYHLLTQTSRVCSNRRSICNFSQSGHHVLLTRAAAAYRSTQFNRYHQGQSDLRRQRMRKEDEVYDKLREIFDNNQQKDLVTLNRVKKVKVEDCGNVQVILEFPTMALPGKEMLCSQAKQSLKDVEWVKTVSIDVQITPPKSLASHTLVNLQNVRNIIVVSSCKGGVGKSTVAVNLAFSLSRLGAKVGLLDADIHGPSIPVMTGGQKEEKLGMPVMNDGVKIMSYGFSNKGQPLAKQLAAIRGPMVNRVIDQLLAGTKWGQLEYLVIDLPPGTGDIHITLGQRVPITAAVIVTTPSRLSYVDVVKGLELFNSMKVPTVAIVENMSYFECDHGTRYYPFGRGYLAQLQREYSIPHSIMLPLVGAVSDDTNSGRPTAQYRPEHSVALKFQDLAEKVVAELDRWSASATPAPDVSYVPTRGVILRFFEDGCAEEVAVSALKLRQMCQCAECVDEVTGRKLLHNTNIPADIKPTSILRMGNYAAAFNWSDGHSSSIYTYSQMRALAKSQEG